MTKIKLLIFGLITVLTTGLALPATVTFAECTNAASCALDGSNQAKGGGTTKSVGDIIGIIANMLIVIIGAVAAIMIIVGGVKYVTSQGDEKSVVGAKHTILYSVIGLIVAITAYAIVNFVITSFTGGGGGGGGGSTDSKKPDLKT